MSSKNGKTLEYKKLAPGAGAGLVDVNGERLWRCRIGGVDIDKKLFEFDSLDEFVAWLGSKKSGHLKGKPWEMVDPNEEIPGFPIPEGIQKESA